jgi:hypothetical protein
MTAFLIYISLLITPMTTSGWLAERVIPLHLIPVALAAWALWVILSSARNTESPMEAAP